MTSRSLLALNLVLASCAVPATGEWQRALGDDAPLVADAGPPLHALVGETVTLDASASQGAVSYRWDFGDGTAWSEYRAEARAQAVYEQPGRYTAVVAAEAADGARSYAATTVTVTYPASFTPSGSSTVAVIRGRGQVAVVSPDSDELSVFDYPGFRLRARHRTCDHPRTVTVWRDWLIVPCQDDDRIALIRHRGGTERVTLDLPWGARPFGAAALGQRAYVTLAGEGKLAELSLDAQGRHPRITRQLRAITDARAIAALPGNRLAVTRWRSPGRAAEIAIVNPAGGAPELLELPLDPTESTDSVIGGVPGYLAELAVSPTGREAILPAQQAAVHEGLHRAGLPHTFETTVRGIAVTFDVDGSLEERERLQFDNRGMTSAATWTRRGDWIYLADRGTRSVERIDPWGGGSAGSIQEVGFAPDGLALSDDDRWLFVVAYLSRELVVYDVSGDLGDEPAPTVRLPLASAEPLAPEVLEGKQLFNDALDVRLGKDGYLACAHCHLDGESDLRVWDFSHRGEGLRNTTSLLGRAGTAHGPVHWSANFDEIQDFENDIRQGFLGTGLMSDDDFAAGTRAHPLGDAKAGLSPELDALAAYVASLDRFQRSAWRDSDGTLGSETRRGRALFRSARLGCRSCHVGDRLTDSGFVSAGLPRLHDVGTLGPGSGQRLGGPLTGLDTPTLFNLAGSEPYLHDGSAPTIRAVLRARNPDDRHGKTRHLSERELEDLERYLLSLDAAGQD